jgi:hypothetical protein
MRLLLALAFVALLASGCLSGTPDAATASATATTTSLRAPRPTAPAQPLATDTLHLLAPPDLATAKPMADTDTTIAIPSLTANLAGAAAGSGFLEWTLDLPRDLTTLVGNATLWVDVEGQVFGDPSPASHCFWTLQLTFDPSQTATTSACGDEPVQVADGVRAVQLALPAAQGTFEKGRTLYVLLSTTATPAPGSTVDLLTGSRLHDSQLTIAGLQLPLPRTALLGAAAATT